MHSDKQAEGQLTAATKHHFILLGVTARPRQTDALLGTNPHLILSAACVWILEFSSFFSQLCLAFICLLSCSLYFDFCWWLKLLVSKQRGKTCQYWRFLWHIKRYHTIWLTSCFEVQNTLFIFCIKSSGMRIPSSLVSLPLLSFVWLTVFHDHCIDKPLCLSKEAVHSNYLKLCYCWGLHLDEMELSPFTCEQKTQSASVCKINETFRQFRPQNVHPLLLITK